ncbi:hypothetical protein CANMA_000761 [Candida margitis]|uniref:uncharacterized protein n=1 Tax=Candida margitis TaxID=1775924 RepID=UPI0022278539|nr:uncharacterized protein CANMA_000761 [Candida margitis]KAI5970150.1 hypothetical protein CANMA_000761 [Candida margitis]
MHLSDLPFEVLRKIVSLAEYSLFKLPPLKKAYQVTCQLGKYQYFKSVYEDSVYINAGNKLDSKFYTKYIIIDLKDLKLVINHHLKCKFGKCSQLYSYYDSEITTFLTGYKLLKYWTGKFDKMHYLQFPDIGFMPGYSRLKKAALIDLPYGAYREDPYQGIKRLNTQLYWKSESDYDLVRNLYSITISLTVGQYLQFTKNMRDFKGGLKLSPTILHIYLRFAPQNIDGKIHSIPWPYPKAFPKAWIDYLFDFSRLQVFALRYFAPETTLVSVHRPISAIQEQRHRSKYEWNATIALSIVIIVVYGR